MAGDGVEEGKNPSPPSSPSTKSQKEEEKKEKKTLSSKLQSLKWSPVMGLCIGVAMCSVGTAMFMNFGWSYVGVNGVIVLLLVFGWYAAVNLGKKKKKNHHHTTSPPSSPTSEPIPSPFSPLPPSALSPSSSPPNYSNTPPSSPNTLPLSPPSPQPTLTSPPPLGSSPTSSPRTSPRGSPSPPLPSRRASSPWPPTKTQKNSFLYRILLSDSQGEKWGYMQTTDKGHYRLAAKPSSLHDSSYVYLVHHKILNRVEVIALQSVLTGNYLSRAHFAREATSTQNFKPHESITVVSHTWRIYKNGMKDPMPFYVSSDGDVCIGKSNSPLSFRLLQVPEGEVTMEWAALRKKWFQKQEKRNAKMKNKLDK